MNKLLIILTLALLSLNISCAATVIQNKTVQDKTIQKNTVKKKIPLSEQVDPNRDPYWMEIGPHQYDLYQTDCLNGKYKNYNPKIHYLQRDYPDFCKEGRFKNYIPPKEKEQEKVIPKEYIPW